MSFWEYLSSRHQQLLADDRKFNARPARRWSNS
ncbi:hypothetical protein J2Z21_007408 [Streptomyces griseochromogenes]|uniref:Uncharacterized protein n=1 Tax=Streptomyces griseochromogenes TaxID=68214 RepID=A0ABS4M434_9ACTN|nr:hypothetical protein [Streptomyces griseochromogenes]